MSNTNNVTIGDIRTVYKSLQKWRTSHSTNEVIITQSELAVLSNIDEEQIDVIIHYLEHNTSFDEKPVIKREENTQRSLQLKFERAYQMKALSDTNNPTDVLLHIFESQDEWCLNEQHTRDIDVFSLLTHLNTSTNLGWKIDDLNNEIFGLVASGVLTYKSKGHIFWKCKKDDALKALSDVEQEVYSIFANMSKVDKDKFKYLSEIYLDFTETRLEHFLFALSRENAERLRLFEIFKRETRHYYSKRYKVKRWKRQTKPAQEVLVDVFRQLQQVVQRLAPEVLQTNESKIFNLLEVTNSKEERQFLDQRLYWLDILGIISYTREFSTEVALKINLLQKNISGSDLKIDLEDHGQSKANTERKLLLMKEYAMIPSGQRASLFERYFRGQTSLM